MLKNNTFLNQFLLEFSSLWHPKTEGKFVVFWISIEKADFVKIIMFPKENCYFSGFELPKMDQISMQFFFSKVTSEKKALKSNLGIVFGFQKPPELLPKAMLNEACFTTLWNPPGSRRKLTDPIAFGLSKRLRI